MNSDSRQYASLPTPSVTPPAIDPAVRPLKASELATDAGANDASASGGAKDRGGVLREHTRPDEIEIERAEDIDNPGATPEEMPASPVPAEEDLPPD